MARQASVAQDWRRLDLWPVGDCQDLCRARSSGVGNDGPKICWASRQAEGWCSISCRRGFIGNTDPALWVGRSEISRTKGQAPFAWVEGCPTLMQPGAIEQLVQIAKQ